MLRHIALYKRTSNNKILLQPKVIVIQKGLMLLGDGVNLLYKLLLMLYIVSSTLSAQEKNLKKKLSSTKLTVEHVFGMLKVKWRLTTLVANTENDPNMIVTCFVFHNFVTLMEKRICKTIFLMKL